MDQQGIPEQRHGHHRDWHKPRTNPVQKGSHFRHQHLGFGVPALLLVGTFEAGDEVHRMVGLHIEVVKVLLAVRRSYPLRMPRPQMIQTDRVRNKIKAFAFRRRTEHVQHGGQKLLEPVHGISLPDEAVDGGSSPPPGYR